MNHMQSLKFEHKLYTSVKIKMEEMQQHNMSWIEVTTAWASGIFVFRSPNFHPLTHLFVFFLLARRFNF